MVSICQSMKLHFTLVFKLLTVQYLIFYKYNIHKSEPNSTKSLFQDCLHSDSKIFVSRGRLFHIIKIPLAKIFFWHRKCQISLDSS